MENCEICGKDLEVGEQCYATTSGCIETFDGFSGFGVDDSEWFNVICSDCQDKVDEAIAELTKIEHPEFVVDNILNFTRKRLSNDGLATWKQATNTIPVFLYFLSFSCDREKPVLISLEEPDGDYYGTILTDKKVAFGTCGWRQLRKREIEAIYCREADVKNHYKEETGKDGT